MRDEAVLFAVVVAILFLAAIGRELAINREERALAEEQRRHVFCDLLEEGMTHAEVYEVLAQVGPCEEHRNNFSGDYLLSIVYTSPKVRPQFIDGVFLWFRNDAWYGGASIKVSLCDRAPLCEK